MRTSLLTVLLILAGLTNSAGCADAGTAATADGQVTLALSGIDVPAGGHVVTTFTQVGEAIPTFIDTFEPSAADASRNYRLAPELYDIETDVLDAQGNVVLTGKVGGYALQPGNNTLSLFLKPVEDDLADILVNLEEAEAVIAALAADANVQQGTESSITMILSTEDPAQASGLVVEGVVSAHLDLSGTTVDIGTLNATPDPDNPLLVNGTVGVDWLGPATLELALTGDGQVQDATTKTIVGLPAAETQTQLQELAGELFLIDGSPNPFVTEPPAVVFETNQNPEDWQALYDLIASIEFAETVGAPPEEPLGKVALLHASLGFYGCADFAFQCFASPSAACLEAAGAAGCREDPVPPVVLELPPLQ